MFITLMPGVVRVWAVSPRADRNWKGLPTTAPSLRVEPMLSGGCVRREGGQLRVWAMPGWHYRRRNHVQRFVKLSLTIKSASSWSNGWRCRLPCSRFADQFLLDIPSFSEGVWLKLTTLLTITRFQLKLHNLQTSTQTQTHFSGG